MKYYIVSALLLVFVITSCKNGVDSTTGATKKSNETPKTKTVDI